MLVVTPSPRAPHRYSHSRLQISREASPCSSRGLPPPSPPTPPTPARANTSCPLISLCIGNRKILKPSFSFSFRNGRNLFRKSSVQRERNRDQNRKIYTLESEVFECTESCHVSSEGPGHSKCQCRKCSLISLGDVDTREVHSMIRFIKQNKVCSNHQIFIVKFSKN